MSQQIRNAAANARLVAAINALDTKTTNALAAAIAALPSAAAIDDNVTATDSVWSSNKTQAQITAGMNAIIGGAGVDNDTLQELANQITALAQADAGLVSATAVQAFNTAEQLQACTNIGIGDPEHDFVPAIEAALNAGL